MSQRLAYFQVAPEALKALSATRTYIQSSGIEPRLRALVELRVSQINGCAYCVDMHSREARQAGGSQQRLHRPPGLRGTPLFDHRQRAPLARAESRQPVAETGRPHAVYEA